MKNKKSILYINFFVMLFAAIVVLVNFVAHQYFILFSIALAILSIAFLSIAILMLFSEKSKQIIKQEEAKIIEKTQKEPNLYDILINRLSNINTSQNQEDILMEKLRNIAEDINLVAALLYWIEGNNLVLKNTYALEKESYKKIIEKGVGLTGQVAQSGQYIRVEDIDKINIEIISGLGFAKPKNLYLLPIFKKENIIAVVELATFSEIKEKDIKILIDVLSSNE